jgi:HD-like signal output (HDOD) protein
MRLFPVAAHKVLKIARSHDATVRDMEKAVSSDPVLAGRVLKLANSPLYARAAKLDSLQRAIQMLGFLGTRDVALALALSSIGTDRTPWGGVLWKHAVSASLAARVLNDHLRRGIAQGSFLAALLHDVGRQLMLTLDEKAFDQIMQAELAGADPLPLEKEAFGVDHVALGAACLHRWSFPGQLADAVGSHHLVNGQVKPVGVAIPRDVAVLQLCDAIADLHDAGADADTLGEELRSHPAAKLLALNQHRLRQVARDLTLLEVDLAVAA